MRFNVFVFVLLLAPLVFAQNGFEPKFGDELTQRASSPGFGSQEGSFGTEVGRGLGSSIVEGSGVGSTLSGVMETLQIVMQLMMLAVLAVVVIFFVWLILILFTLRSIMKRDDLTGGEKAAWVAIVFFFGFLPLSPFGMLLYALTGKKKAEQPPSKTK